MTQPTRRPGRPVSQQSRQAVLRSAAELLDERGWGGFTVDEVARRSGVSKATIYKHWSGGFAVAVDAYGTHVTDAVPTVSTGDAAADLADQVVRLAAFYAGPRGHVVAQLLAAGTTEADGPELLRRHFFGARRDATTDLIEAGKVAGQLRGDVDTQLAVDLLFAPIVFRLFNGMAPLDPAGARALAETALRSLVAS